MSSDNKKVVYNPSSSAGQLLYTLTHLQKQQKESSKYDDNVIDYNDVPLSSQPQNQAQQARVPLPRKPKVANITKETFYVGHKRSLVLRNNILAFFLVAIILLLFFLILRVTNTRI